MEQTPPVWLNKTFLDAVLQEGCEERPRVTDFTVKPAVAGGSDNFSCHIFRVRVVYEVEEPPAVETERTSFVVKTPVIRGPATEEPQKSELFGKEHKVYNSLLPRMSEKVDVEFAPATFYCPIKNFLVLEDLAEVGYVMCDESKQLDFFHCKKVVETLAKFHASSVACLRDDPGFVESVGEDVLWTEGCFLEPWVKCAVKTVIRLLSGADGCEPFTNFLIGGVNHFWESIVAISKPKAGSLNVLNHGDLWANNMLFKYDEVREVEDVKLVDFQVTRVATPALDLVHFIWSSANEEVRETKQPELYNMYLRELNTTLEQLGCEERYTLENLREDLRWATDWGVLMICCALPVILSPPEDALDPSQLGHEALGTHKFDKIYSGKNFRALLPNVVKQFTQFFLTENTILSHC